MRSELSPDEIAAALEPLFQKVVQEEVERVLKAFLLPSPGQTLNQTGTCGTSGLQLCFIDKLPPTVFTLTKLEAVDGTAIKVALFDARSQSRVNDGPLSSIKIEICVLNGDFGSDDNDNWSKEDFNASVVRERDGKRPLLTGDLIIKLQKGVACIGNNRFSDNSSWLRTRMFRLGARVVQQIPSEGYIREARSERFTVKDRRGELYKKHFPPSLNDEIWRLKNISKDGKFHKKLSSCGIRSVKDLLQLYVTNPSSLQKKFGKISKKCWEAIIDHAKACLVDNQNLYIYHTTEPPISILFNSIYMVVAVTFDGQKYYALDTLTSAQKHLVENVKQQAYKNVNGMISVDEQSTDSLLRSLAADQCIVPEQDPPQFVFPVADQDQQETWLGLINYPSASTSYAQGAVSNNQEVYVAENGDQMPEDSFSKEDFFSGISDKVHNWSQSGTQVPFMPGAGSYLAENDNSQIQMPGCFLAAPAYEQGNGFHFASVDGTEYGMLPSFTSSGVQILTGKPKAGWCKIRAAMKWGISVRRVVADKQLANLL
ncbi:Calmodulin-binding protein [Quillaja saponaria]|uniref:Calmodulin-binding protein n=1 Tax=Quillaja saponaria TaxID=32244 RepID=A0AAD7Q1T1_QUISA|nr:Calmodulin-binding protein [Quillaja saponaria]